MYSQPGPYPSQQPSGGTPYYQPEAYPPPQPNGSPYPQSPYPPQQPATNYFPPQQAGGVPYYQQNPYPPQPVYRAPQFGIVASNPRAKRAMINGFISLVLSLITLFTLVGYAGVITGTFAIVYGFIGLNQSNKLPNNVGRTQAITGIALGFVAWFIVILSLIMRMALSTMGG